MNSTNGNDNGGTVSPETMALWKATVRDCAQILERARCLGLIRMACEAAAVGAGNPDEVQAIAALHRTLHMLVVHPDVQARHPMPAREPPKPAHHDPIRLDKLVAAMAECLRVRRGQVIDDALVIERARTAAIYAEEIYADEDEDTLPGVQVTVRDTASAPNGKN
jgi:hypothetical protein